MKRAIAWGVLSLAACGGQPDANQAEQSQGTAGSEERVSRAELFEEIAAAMPPAVCEAGTPLRTCFAVSGAECEATFRDAVRACEQSLGDQVPDPVPSDQESLETYGQLLGNCAGHGYTDRLADRRVNGEGCPAAQ